MGAQPVSIRIPEEVREEIEEIARCKSRTFTSVVNEMLTEAVKMRRIPGIDFVDGLTGRRARIVGTGLEVWEVISGYRAEDENWEHLKEAFLWLSDFQLRAALAYAEAYPDEINERIRRNEELSPEVIWAKYPYMKPPWR
jgi:uncharacterized protein (DUF433 family)